MASEQVGITFFVLLCLLAVCRSGSGPGSGGQDDSKNKKHEQAIVAVPRFYLAKSISQCRVDSPEIFFDKVAYPSVSSLLEEGKIFFGVLMDRLESSLAGAEKYENLEKEWTFLLNVINESFDLAINRIEKAWEDIIDHSDMIKLPWEKTISDAFFLELFTNLQYQYQIVESVVRAGTKEIVSTLQTYLVEVMQKLEDKIFTESSETPKTEKEIMNRMEKAVSSLEPNFIGKLITKILRKMRDPEWHLSQTESILNFLEEPMSEIAITAEAYRTRGNEFPFFWSEMTLILRGTNNTIDPSSEQLFQMYMTDEDMVINAVVNLLTNA